MTMADSEAHTVEENSADAAGDSVAAADTDADEDGIDAVADREYTEADADSEVVSGLWGCFPPWLRTGLPI